MSLDVSEIFRCNHAMSIEIITEDARWNTTDLPALVVGATGAVLQAHDLDPAACEIGVLACDDQRITALNTDYRDKPAPTNVLSWPTTNLAPEIAGNHPTPPQVDIAGNIMLGDIAIAYETCKREADAAGKPMTDHVTHLIIHGVLHLLGYDHVRDLDATLMERLEVEILGRLGVDDPYRETDGPRGL